MLTALHRLYPAEINPLRTRTNANAVSTTSNWLFNFAVVQFTPPFLDATAWGCFLFFAVMNALFIPVIWFFYIETAGRTLEEIDLIFASGFAQNKSYVAVANHLPKLEDSKIQSELARLHDEHLARKGQAPEEGNADERTFVEAGDEARADANIEKAKEMRGSSPTEQVSGVGGL